MTATVLDTINMPWESNGDSRIKTLHVDRVKQRSVVIRFFPPGGAVTPYRWFHRSVRETFLFLWGEYPGWEFSGPEDTAGRVVPFRAMSFMDRPPLSLHGRRPAASMTGSEFLQWHSHGGAFDNDPNESEALPFGAPSPPGVSRFRPPDVVATESLPWQPHPALPGALIRLVARAPDDAPAGHYPITMVSLPRDWSGGDAILAAGGRPWVYVLWGDLALRVDGTERRLSRGFFLDWDAPGDIRHGGAKTGGDGCVVFCVGHVLASSPSVTAPT